MHGLGRNPEQCNQIATIFNQVTVKNDPSCIQCWDSISRPFDCHSPPITTRPVHGYHPFLLYTFLWGKQFHNVRKKLKRLDIEQFRTHQRNKEFSTRFNPKILYRTLMQRYQSLISVNCLSLNDQSWANHCREYFAIHQLGWNKSKRTWGCHLPTYLPTYLWNVM